MTRVQAVSKDSILVNNNIRYYFVSDDKLISSVFEFEMNSLTGQILLAQSLNRNISKFRELTLAARLETNDQLDQLISYQYFCINIGISTKFEPCFRTTAV